MTINYYGIIIGVSLIIFFLLSEKKAKAAGIDENYFFKIFIFLMIAALIGARAWHIFTDFTLYTGRLLDIFKVWQGGLSIIGALLGGFLALLLLSRLASKSWRKKKSRLSVILLLDIFAFALPFAQAVGRLANYFNQELYGLPSNLPWAIYIKPENRIADYEDLSYYHPLFAYEAILMLAFAFLIWGLEKNFSKKGNSKTLNKQRQQLSQTWQLGSGLYFQLYFFYYASIRFLLDFLRVEKEILPVVGLGINQLFLLFLLIALFIHHFVKIRQRRAKL
jgi:phosphatidylglycerol:prolipoprotein diacylglycerol transferase